MTSTYDAAMASVNTEAQLRAVQVPHVCAELLHLQEYGARHGRTWAHRAVSFEQLNRVIQSLDLQGNMAHAVSVLRS